MRPTEASFWNERSRSLADAGLTLSALAFIAVYVYLGDSLAFRHMAAAPPAHRPHPSTSLTSTPPKTLPQAEQGMPVFCSQPGSGAADDDDRTPANDLQRRVAALELKMGNLVRGEVSDGVVHVPLTEVGRMIGGDVRWDPDTRTGALITDEALTRLCADSSKAVVNEEVRQLPSPVRLLHGKPFLPIRALSALYGASLRGDPRTGLVHVKADGGTFTVAVPEQLFRMEISRSERWLRVFYAGRLVKEYPVCVGAGNNTPVGHFHIQNKAVWPSWRAYWGELIPSGSPRNPLGARWLGTTARGRVTGWPIGIHGTNQPSSIGQRISGGCIRTYNHHAIELYDTIPIGTAVWIHE